MKPKAYKTLIELFASDLDISVMKHLEDGWSLHGYSFVSPCPEEMVPGERVYKYLCFHCQVVIKE